MAAGAWLYFAKRRSAALRPLAYACLLAAPGVLLLINLFGAWDRGSDVTPVWPSSVLLALGLLWLYRRLGGPGAYKAEWARIAVVATVLLAAFTNPGVLAAIGLLAMGYALADRTLLALGAAFLPTFIVLYYYALNVSLAYKSWVLAGSGALLLIVRWVVKRRLETKEAAS